MINYVIASNKNQIKKQLKFIESFLSDTIHIFNMCRPLYGNKGWWMSGDK